MKPTEQGIRIETLTKTFPGTALPAVSNLTFAVEPGEVVGLLGANGAGKTTLLRMISTLLKPSGGTVSVAGYDTGRDPRSVRARVGALFGGTLGLYGRLTARENIRYFGALNGMQRSEVEKRVEQLIVLFGLDDFIDRTVATFSSGMKQRTALARTTVHDPDFLLLDEPTTGLDISAALDVQQFVSRCRIEGKTVLLSSHNTGELEQVCDRVLMVHGGRLLAEVQRDTDFGEGSGRLRTRYLDAIRSL